MSLHQTPLAIERFDPAPDPAPARSPLPLPAPAAEAAGSRRRRLWELDDHAHCPVVGVCLPLATVRRIAAKVLELPADLDDYELHCGLVQACKQRDLASEAVQKELDRRYALAVAAAAKQRGAAALAGWWDAALAAGTDLAGPFWAALTHPRCDADLERRILGTIHMLQHQIGAERRVGHKRFAELQAQHAALGCELAEVQRRHRRQMDELTAHNVRLQTDAQRMQAALITRDAMLAQLRARQSDPDVSAARTRERFALLRRQQLLEARLTQLQQALGEAQQECQRLAHRAAAAEAALAQREAEQAAQETAAGAPAPLPQLAERAVLCVGGRRASVPLYRRTIERSGARFLHHDGGNENSPAQLEATLAAADLVICQTGCISHAAYWRVKHHCKRTGKQCVFVETPSRAALERALDEVGRRMQGTGSEPAPPASTVEAPGAQRATDVSVPAA